MDHTANSLIFAYVPPGIQIGTGVPNIEFEDPYTGEKMYVSEHYLWDFMSKHLSFYK